eukprot:Filipodium_phascolosomae@DN6271_c0_g1_i1.p1
MHLLFCRHICGRNMPILFATIVTSIQYFHASNVHYKHTGSKHVSSFVASDNYIIIAHVLCVCWNELQMGAYMVSQAVILEAVAILKEPDFAQGMLLASASQLNKDSEEHTIGCMVALLRGLYGEHA